MDFNVFEGITVEGINRITISKGKIVYQNNKAQVEEGVGEYVKRPAHAPYFDALRRSVAINKPQAVRR